MVQSGHGVLYPKTAWTGAAMPGTVIPESSVWPWPDPGSGHRRTIRLIPEARWEKRGRGGLPAKKFGIFTLVSIHFHKTML